MRNILIATGAVALVVMLGVTVKLSAQTDPSCYKRCGCGETVGGQQNCHIVRSCSGGADCVWCDCTLHKDCGSGAGYGDHNWNDECGAVPFCEAQGSQNCHPLGS